MVANTNTRVFPLLSLECRMCATNHLPIKSTAFYATIGNWEEKQVQLVRNKEKVKTDFAKSKGKILEIRRWVVPTLAVFHRKEDW